MDFADLFQLEMAAVIRQSRKGDSGSPEVRESTPSLTESSLKRSAFADTAEFVASIPDKGTERITKAKFRDETTRSDMDDAEDHKPFTSRVIKPDVEGDEPFVGYTAVNLVALCFSGGGIRSSTFNLGVLQGLREKGILGEFDYLSTVSGGGYVGSWWTAWRHRNRDSEDAAGIFPVTAPRHPEPLEISWLRQRGDFLSPMAGLFEGEIWRGIFLYFLGLFLTLTASISLLAIVLSAVLILPLVLNTHYLALTPSLILFLCSIATACSALSAATPDNRRQKLATQLSGAAIVFAMLGIAAWAALSLNWLITVVTSSAITATAGAIFFKFGGLISRRDVNERPSAVHSMLTRHIPKLLSILGVFGLCLIAATLFISFSRMLGGQPFGFILAFLVFVASFLLATAGASKWPTLHAFYRSRIAQTFLSIEDDKKATSENDFPLSDLGKGIADRPVHLINCCSNEANGSNLKRRGRNGASATLSPLACNVGNAAANAGNCSLATAVTASAAATNPFMGQYSAQLGTAVSFLMAALNLRLGIWVVDPHRDQNIKIRAEADRKPGPHQNSGLGGRCLLWSRHKITNLFSQHGTFLCELAGKPKLNNLIHLSDGGHFENLGLYEMIRRQCRYILVSDCGADPSITFAEFAHLQRLVRQDFGVEIEIDLNTLREGPNGLSSRHMAAGKIKYPGTADNNLGILIYMKPTLTGDEPEDVLQYRSSNRAFPHESTLDQFYDSAQWESYRQLGYHSILTGFGFFGGYEQDDVTLAPRAFDAAAREWEPSQTRRTMETSKPLSIESDGAIRFARQVFPELEDDPDAIHEFKAVFDSVQSLEKEFENRDLSKNMDCLDNWGWVNWGDRLVSAKAVRRWWPYISPLFNVRFRNELMDIALGMNPTQALYAEIAGQRCVRLGTEDILSNCEGIALDRWLKTFGSDWSRRGGEHFLITFEMPSPITTSKKSIQFGTLFFSVVDVEHEDDSAGAKVIQFYEGDIQVAPGHWSVGIQAKLLNIMLLQIKQGLLGCRADLKAIQVLPNERFEWQEELAANVQRPSLLHFFLKYGFVRRYDGIFEKPVGEGMLPLKS